MEMKVLYSNRDRLQWFSVDKETKNGIVFFATCPTKLLQLIGCILMMYASARDLLGLNDEDSMKTSIEGGPD